MNVISKLFESRKALLTLIVLLITALNNVLSLGLDTATIQTMAASVAAYCVGNGLAAKKK